MDRRTNSLRSNWPISYLTLLMNMERYGLSMNAIVNNELIKVVMMTAGASFSAALTDKGSVIAWGNLRVSSWRGEDTFE